MNLFLNVIGKLKESRELIAIRTDKDDTSKFAVGYVEDYNESMVYIRSIDPEGNEDGYIYYKMEEIYQIQFQNRYLSRLKLLITNKHILDESVEVKVESGSEDYIIRLLKKAMKDNLLVTINLYDFSLIGYIMEVDSMYCQIHEITDDGDDDGITVILIENIERVYIAGRDQRKVELFYKKMPSV